MDEMVTSSLNERQATTDEMALVSNALAAYSFIAGKNKFGTLLPVAAFAIALQKKGPPIVLEKKPRPPPSHTPGPEINGGLVPEPKLKQMLPKNKI